jgi:hypothetical protein
MTEDKSGSAGSAHDSQPHNNSADPGPVGVAFAQVTGALGGFCITIMVLALTPGVFEPPGPAAEGRLRDWLIATLMLAAGTYITSAGILANAQNTLALEHRVRRDAFTWGIVLFHIANMLLSAVFVMIAFKFPLSVTRVVSIIICVFATLVALANIITAIARGCKKCKLERSQHMPQIQDWANVFSTLKDGNREALQRLQRRVDNSGNDQITLEWDLEYQPEHGQLLSLFNITPRNLGGVLICVLAGLQQGETILASSLASQTSDVTADGNGSYTGWVWCDYQPSGPATIEGHIQGTLRSPNGTDQTFSFSKTIQVGG